MALANILPHNNQRGFTLVELLIVMAISAAIFCSAMTIGFSAYKSYTFHTEKNMLTGALQKARAQSLSNINQTRHGVRIEASPLRFIIFECPAQNTRCLSYAPASTDVIINTSYGTSLAAPVTLPIDMVFEQLSGNCVSAGCTGSGLSLSLTNGVATRAIFINSEGRIDWQ